MQSSGGDRSPVDELADSFLARLRRGEHPSVSEYAQRHPELADEIEEVFPTLAMLEQLNPPAESEASSDFPSVPRELGAYRILREVGRGGMGVVYEAEHDTMRRRVALKVLQTKKQNRDTYLQRFYREARAAGRLHHTNIVPVFEVGAHDGIHFYAMQFIQGQNLDVVLDELRLMEAGNGRRMSAPTVQPGLHDATTEPGVHPPGAMSGSVARALMSGQFQRPSPATWEDEPAADDEQSGHSEQLVDQSLEVAPRGDPAAQSAGEGGPETKRASGGESIPVGTRSSARHSTLFGGRSRTDPTNDSQSLASVVESLDESGASSGSLRIGNSTSETSRASESYFHRVARIGLQAAEALDHAHSQGVLHRDIKPSNLILDTAGVVWITDFGLAKNEGDDLTNSGDIVGTLRYMAPERFRGEGDERSDIYGLGLTLYELCTLQPAFAQTDRANLVRHVMEHEPDRPRRRRPQLPRDLETIILKAIDRDPRGRYQRARQVADDLQLFLADRPIKARRISVAERLWRWCRRNPQQATLAGCVALLMAVLVVGSLSFAYITNHQSRKLQASQRDSLRYLYKYSKGQAEAGRWSGMPGQQFKTLDAVARAAQLLPEMQLSPALSEQERVLLRNEAIGSFPLDDLREVRSWKVTAPGTGRVAFHPDYLQFAQVQLNGEILIRDVTQGRTIYRLPSRGSQITRLRFTNDGRYLIALHDQSPRDLVQIWDVGQRRLVGGGEVGRGYPFLATNDQSTRLAVSGDAAIHVFDIESGKQVAKLADRNPSHVALSPAGTHVLFASGGRTLKVVEIETEKLELIKIDSQIMSVAWHPGGDDLMAGCRDGVIRVYSAADLTVEPRRIEGHRSTVTGIRPNHRGDRLVTLSWDGTCRVFDYPTGKQVLRIANRTVGHHPFSRDDSRLGFWIDDGTFGICEVARHGPRRLLRTPGGGTRWTAAFDPSSRFIASACGDTVEIWWAATGERLATLAQPYARDAQFTPDGSALFTSGASGVHRRPLTWNEEERVLRIGPPESLYRRPASWLSLNQQGSFLAFGSDRAAGNNAMSLTIGPPSQVQQIGRHTNIDHVELSPDGRWIVSTTWQGRGIKVWDHETGKLAKLLEPSLSSSYPRFSHDGKWLALSSARFHLLYEVGTWKCLRRTERPGADGWPGAVAFSPDDRILVLAKSRFALNFVEPVSGKSLGTFESYQGFVSCRFSPDSRFFAAATNSMHVWDLAELRRRLKQLHLDWNLPSLPSPPPPSPPWRVITD